MRPAPGSYWTFWPNPDPDFFGQESYSWSFLLKVDLPAVIGLLLLFSLPPVHAWTGAHPLVLAVGFAVHFFYGAGIAVIGLDRIHPRPREFFSHLVNLVAAVAIPVSSARPLFILWIMYLLIVWMDGFGNPKSAASILLSFAAPWADVLWHWGSAAAGEKAVLAGITSVSGAVIYLIASYFSDWSRGAGRKKSIQAGERAALAERERIGRNLHGTLGAALSEISLWHEVALAGGAAGKTSEAGETDPLVRAQARAKAALTELRSLVAGIDNEPSSLSGLAEALRRQAGGLCEAAGVTFDLTVAREETLSQAAAYHAAKIAVEGVTNAVRHGKARRVSVSLSAGPLEITIEDDGTGFQVDGAARGRGLRSLAEHAEALGAALEIDSAPGKGTRVRVRKIAEAA